MLRGDLFRCILMRLFLSGADGVQFSSVPSTRAVAKQRMWMRAVCALFYDPCLRSGALDRQTSSDPAVVIERYLLFTVDRGVSRDAPLAVTSLSGGLWYTHAWGAMTR